LKKIVLDKRQKNPFAPHKGEAAHVTHFPLDLSLQFKNNQSIFQESSIWRFFKKVK